MPDCYSRAKNRPAKVLHGIPNYETHRNKLCAKWRRKGFNVRFA